MGDDTADESPLLKRMTPDEGKADSSKQCAEMDVQRDVPEGVDGGGDILTLGARDVRLQHAREHAVYHACACVRV